MNDPESRKQTQTRGGETTELSARGLSSIKGIRWILMAGSLLTAVSVYHLAARHWNLIPVELQYLIVVAGALGLYASGDIARHRLHLRSAGATLLLLFTALVPVLSVGAVYLKLLSPGRGIWGPAAFLAGMAAMTAASARVVRKIFRYEGRLYLVVLLILATAPPFLARIAGSISSAAGQGFFYAGAVLGLGLAMHLGCRDINRFLFHRDRLDGMDRPVSFMPFLVLGVLYVTAVAGLEFLSTLDSDLSLRMLALPLAVLGAVLAGTGEEYYRALVRSTGRVPDRWPVRSLAPTVIGFALLTISLPLSYLDDSRISVALSGLLAGWIWVRWSWRYRSALAQPAGLVAAIIGYHHLPAFWPRMAQILHFEFAEAAGLGRSSPALVGFGHLPLLAGLIVLAWLLRRAGHPERVRRSLAIFTGLHVSGLAILSLQDLRGSLLVLPFLLAAAGMALAAGRRVELVYATQVVMGALIASATARASGAGELVTFDSLRAVSLGGLALLVASRWLEGPLGRVLGKPLSVARTSLVLPAVFLVFFLFPAGTGRILGGENAGGLELVIAGLLLAVLGHRVRHPLPFAAGVLAVSAGAHAWVCRVSLVSLLEGSPAPLPFLTVVSLVVFVLAWMVDRFGSALGDSVEGTWKPGALLAMGVHAVLGVLWLLAAMAHGTVTLEPLALLVIGSAFAEEGWRRCREATLVLGVYSLVVFVPLQIWGLDRTETFCGGMVYAGAALCALILVGRYVASLAAARTRDDFGKLRQTALEQAYDVVAGGWLAVGFLCCLLFSGPQAFLVALMLPLVASLARGARAGKAGGLSPIAVILALVPAVHLPVLMAGAGSGWLVLDLYHHGFALFPLLAAMLAGWIWLVEFRGRMERTWASVFVTALAVESAVVTALLFAFAVRPAMTVLGSAVLAAVFLLFCLRHLRRAVLAGEHANAWMVQAWIGLMALHAVTAGWIDFGHGWSPYVLLAAAAVDFGLGRLAERRPGTLVLAPACRWTGRAAALAAGCISLYRAAKVAGVDDLWFTVLPAYLASAFFLAADYHTRRRVASSLASAGLLFGALLASFHQLTRADILEPQFYCLAPGTTLIALSWALRKEIGAAWTRWLFTVGAAFVYATPIAGLWGDLSWTWQASLLLMSIGFGAASFAMRSRALLTVSTAAMIIDLACFTVLVGRTEPLFLWVVGFALGTALMAAGAWLEYRREGVLQQLRVFGHELRTWY